MRSTACIFCEKKESGCVTITDAFGKSDNEKLHLSREMTFIEVVNLSSRRGEFSRYRIGARSMNHLAPAEKLLQDLPIMRKTTC